MPRFGNRGRFDTRYELKSIYESMQEDLQEFVGQYVEWYKFDAENSVEDPIYDVGAQSGGRRFKRPFTLPCIGVDLEEGVELNTGQGSYTTDICHLVVSYDQASKAGLRKMKTDWRTYFGDRFVYLDTVFQVRNIQIRGPVRAEYEVLGIDGWQVNPEELINDPDFAQYAGANAPLQVAEPEEQTAENDTSLTKTADGRVPGDPLPNDDVYGA